MAVEILPLKKCNVVLTSHQSWAPALFRAFALASVKLKKKRGSAKKKARKKAKAPSAKEKKRKFALFCLWGVVCTYVCMCVGCLYICMGMCMYVCVYIIDTLGQKETGNMKGNQWRERKLRA